ALLLREKCLTISRDTRIDCWSGVRSREECNSLCPCSYQVFRRKIAGAAVVNPDKVIFAALRIGLEIPVQEHHGNSSSVKSSHDPVVCLKAVRAELHRGKKDARDSLSNVMLTELLCRPLLVLVRRDCMAP